MVDENHTTDLRRSRSQGSERSESRPSASAARSASPEPLGGPRQFGRYELVMELAAGGMASLYIGRLRGPESFEKRLVIKIIHPHLTRDRKFVKMFMDEASIAAQIHHPNVTQIFDLGEVDGSYFMAMEYVHGQDMRALLVANSRRRREGDAGPRDQWRYAAAIVAEAAAGLHSAHELRSPEGELLGIVHRDVSPHNLLLSYDGHVKLTDFGIAYARRRLSHTDSGTVKGKIAYMAPEQARGDAVDRRADIFSLGVVLWEAVCLRRLFRRETDTATLLEITQGEVPAPRSLRPDLPPDLEEVVMRALARAPEDRYPTALEMERDLRRLIARGEPLVGAAELGALMEELFRERRVAREDAIRQAMEAPVALQAPAAPMEPTRETRLSAEVQAVVSGPRRSLVGRFGLVLAVLMVALLGLVGYYVLGPGRGGGGSKGGAEAGPAAPAMEVPGPKEAASRPELRRATDRPAQGKLLVTFKVTPRKAEATIHFRGESFRQNSLELFLAPGQVTERLRVEAPGYAPLERFITVQPGATMTHVLELQALPRRGTPIGPSMRPGVGPVDIGLDD
ncbi:MAG: serine/threonine-protein kinase [Polyangia bacterium]|nr:serine/threonine-protein kinase [Polyangia bacterium]